MALASGTKLGPYEIQSPLGAGGMGEVYRARDTRLDRIVAIKILPVHLSENAEARQRFDREARAISSLNHPNICTLYDVGHQDGTDFLAMEFLEGETLADRLRKGALPLQQILKYAAEIGEGLEKAHRTGVVHRDLKPGNIMLTKSGAKLMDFGLAKSTPTIASQSSALTMTQSTPAQAQPLTMQGTIVGTFQYMSPEQIEGKEADARSDIFAFGAVLYEMVTGRRAFEGKSQISVASAILEREPPPISVARHDTPMALERAIAICLAKDPERRWSTAHDVVLQLSLIGSSEADPVKAGPKPLWNTVRYPIALLVLLVGGAAVGGLITRWIQPAPETRLPIRFSIALPKDAPLSLPNPTSELAIAPDGSAIAYVAVVHSLQPGVGSADTAAPVELNSRNTGRLSNSPDAGAALYIRRMDELDSRRIPGTEDAMDPFFSPDGLWVGWFSHGAVRKVMLAGGAPISICEVTSSYMGGAFWAPDDFIYFTPGDLMRVRASGGQPEVLARVDAAKDADYQSPQLLPGGKAVLLTRRPLNITSYGDAAIFAYRLDTHESIPLIEGGAAGMYLRSGHLLYAHGGSIYAMPFDAGSLKVLGPPVEVLRGGMLNENSGNVALAVSANGVVVYAPGGPIASDSEELLEISHAGVVTVISSKLGFLAEPAVSPDGQNLAITIRAANDDIWLFNRARRALTRFTFAGGDNQVPVWSGDGSHVIYSRSNRSRNLYWRPVNGGAEERLTTADNVQFPDSTTPDGKMLAFTQWSGPNSDIYLIPLDGAHTPRPLIATRFNEQDGMFSPDGKWLAYTSDESGRDEVYVQPYGREGVRSVVSTSGGMRPMWDRDGKRLFYSSGDVLMQVAFDSKSGNIGQAAVGLRLPARTAVFGVSPAGNFVGLRTTQSNTFTAPELEVATEWFRELRARLPVGH
ncbi:MAG TPA: protein kinase [Terracidiphilus sp.]